MEPQGRSRAFTEVHDPGTKEEEEHAVLRNSRHACWVTKMHASLREKGEGEEEAFAEQTFEISHPVGGRRTCRVYLDHVRRRVTFCLPHWHTRVHQTLECAWKCFPRCEIYCLEG